MDPTLNPKRAANGAAGALGREPMVGTDTEGVRAFVLKHEEQLEEGNSNLRALQAWKKKRRAIVSELVTWSFHEYEPFDLPDNVIRSHQKRSLEGVPGVEQEHILFESFIDVCRGLNTVCVQCEVDPDAGDTAGELKWHMSAGCSDTLIKWMKECFRMGTSLFELELCIQRIRSDKTRGPTAATFCSVVEKHLRKQFYPALEALDKMEAKNLLSLQRQCSELNAVLSPLKDVARDIEECDLVGGELLNYLYEESQSDRRTAVAELLKQTFSLALKRYYATLHEWMSLCEVTLDLGHEFFVWDLSRVRCVERRDFAAVRDGTDFDNRFVVVEELVPEFLKPVADKVVEAGMYLYTMKSQNADIKLLTAQMSLDGDAFRAKSIGEVRALIRQVHRQCSANILSHLDRKFDVCSFALRLPRYFLAYHSGWIEELVTIYVEDGGSSFLSDTANPQSLQLLLDKALDGDWLKGDAFRTRFQLRASDFHFFRRPAADGADVTVPQLELHINWDPALNLAFPQKVLEPYRQLFRLSFALHRARLLLTRKRLSYGFSPSRQECASIHLMLRFVQAYHSFVFATHLSATFDSFAKKLPQVKSLDELVNEQHEFLCAFCDRAKLDMERELLTESMLSVILTFASYAADEIPFDELNHKVGLKICRLKKMLLQNHDYAPIRSLLFGCNFINISSNEENLEPLWESLRHIEPMQQQQ